MTESGYFDYSGQDPNTFLPPMNPYRDGSDAQDYGSNGKSQLAGFYSNHYPGSQDNPANPSSQASMPNSPDMSVSTGYQHMFPSVPTGNPDDPKDMGAAAASLAKPVPMRRLSEKRIAQARAHLMGPMADYLLDPSYGGSNGKSQLAGFYSNHYPGSQDNPANPSSQASMPNSPDMSVSTGYQHMFPSVPTGNPDDPKDMGAAAASLAKPVPMRRLSEKRIAQARAHLMGPMADYLLDPSYGDLQAATSPAVAHALAATQQTQKRPRSEKKAIPDEAKDDKYFERRKRNNCAAKKSRDARKAREDEIAIRASFLEKENAILRAQVATLREEANSLRQLLLQKRSRP
ncbi:CCAAT/enhancer-binding protein beta [Lingula anatina]|uniref:CCAAT/enhancer-binding protein beta n=1 Tax=Lingula anatina TaxID=7574 RepID=A0A1S3K6G4_LINAN|nr:CCAAT/enhancer-binding protein beta [Lingula anatina]|eukprot:XP_013418024.1 CCAAT/enhancer-binding protein beta [Lingula anatina]